jgi:hypothetical protein
LCGEVVARKLINMDWRYVLFGVVLVLLTAALTVPLAYILWTGIVVDPRDVFPGWMSKVGILIICPGAILYVVCWLVFENR